MEVLCSDSTVRLSSFPLVEHSISSYDSDTHDDILPGSVLQCTKTYRPVNEAAARIDRQISDMVNHVFDISLQE